MRHAVILSLTTNARVKRSEESAVHSCVQEEIPRQARNDNLEALAKEFLCVSVVRSSYSPPTVSPSIRIVGEATAPRNSRSFAISEM